MPEKGTRGVAETIVTMEKTAVYVGSGEAEVFATPMLVALMEKAAYTSVAGALAPGETSVGTRMDVKHLAATPVGARVRAESELTDADGRKLTFRVTAYDDAGLIGEGEHERFVLDAARFTDKAKKRVAPDFT